MGQCYGGALFPVMTGMLLQMGGAAWGLSRRLKNGWVIGKEYEPDMLLVRRVRVVAGMVAGSCGDWRVKGRIGGQRISVCMYLMYIVITQCFKMSSDPILNVPLFGGSSFGVCSNAECSGSLAPRRPRHHWHVVFALCTRAALLVVLLVALCTRAALLVVLLVALCTRAALLVVLLVALCTRAALLVVLLVALCTRAALLVVLLVALCTRAALLVVLLVALCTRAALLVVLLVALCTLPAYAASAVGPNGN